jgi:hypothetical protein
MGIDTPAFSRGVERPTDTAAERGELRTETDTEIVSAGGTRFALPIQNTTNTAKFLVFVSVAQEARAGQPVQDDVTLTVRVQDGVNDIRFFASSSGASLNQRLTAVRVPGGVNVAVIIFNKSNSTVRVNYGLTVREP